MTFTLKDRHLAGVGAAACAVCCAAPLVGLLGLAGAAATAFTLAFAGLAFALVVAALTVGATVLRRRSAQRHPCPQSQDGPVDVTIGPAQ